MNRFLILLVLAATIASAQSTAPIPAGVPSQQEIAELKAKAQTGDPKAQVKLGELYDDGKGVPEDAGAAAQWYGKAAEQGDPAGQNSLGVMYRLGRGVDKDLKEAVRWYQKAARQGYPNAYFNLGTAYYNGDGVPTDYDRAYAWFVLAKEAGSKPAEEAVQRVSQELTRTLDMAYLATGRLLEAGQELPQDLAEAAVWYRKAAELSNSTAQWKLGELYSLGRGVPKDDAAAASWRAKALRGNDPELMFVYANMLRTGNGAAQDLKAAAEWYRRAAAYRHAAATLNLGLMYAQGAGVPRDNVRAYLLIVAAELGGGELSAKASGARLALEKQMSPAEIEKAHKEAKKAYGKWPGGPQAKQ